MRDMTVCPHLPFRTAERTQTTQHQTSRAKFQYSAVLLNSTAPRHVAAVLHEYMQNELIELQEDIRLKEAQCDAITFWTKMVTAAKYPLLHIINS